MSSTSLLRIVSALALAAPVIAAAQAAPASVTPGKQTSPAAAVQFGKLPLSFEPNRGQTANEVQWLARGPEYTLYLAGPDAVLELNSVSHPAVRGRQTISSSAVRMNLLGAKTVEDAAGEDLQAGKSNYFNGRDPSR